MVAYLLIGAFGGLAAGFVLTYAFAVLPRIHDLRRLRYDGFRPESPPPKPKTIPPDPFPREF